MTVSNLTWSLNGFFDGINHVSTFESLSSVMQGQTDFIAYQQSINCKRVAQSFLRFMKDMGGWDIQRTSRRLIARAVSFPIPFFLQMANHRVTNPLLKRSIVFLRNHLNHATFALDVSISLLFAYYVSPIYGASILVGASFELINEYKIVPAKVKGIWEKSYLVISFIYIAQVTYEYDLDLVEMGLIVVRIAIFVWEHYFENHKSLDFDTHSLSASKAQEFLDSPKQFRINKHHINIDPKMTVKGAENLEIIETMKKEVKGVDWTESNLRTFKKMLLANPRFQQLHHDKKVIEDIPDDFAKKEFETGAHLISQEIAYSSIKTGDHYIRYELLQGMLKSILKNFSDNPGHEDDLFLLALEGGDFCAAGKVAVIEGIYNRRILTTGKIPLKTKFLHQLVYMRQRWFEGIYAKFASYTYKLPKGIIDASDIHFRNIALFYFDKCFKLFSEALMNDSTANSAFFCDYLYRSLLSLGLDIAFWPWALKSSNWYGPQPIINEIGEASAFAGISGTEIVQWWKDWIESVPDEVQKNKLTDELLLEGKVFGQDIHIKTPEGQRVNPKLIQLMLYDMNIFKD